jgi:hypothetical protein
MSPVSFASSIDEPANDKFESSDLRGLNHLTDLINERNTTSEKYLSTMCLIKVRRN